jgi:ABC-type transport system involved in multi-copper enzyme maturation permease subunit
MSFFKPCLTLELKRLTIKWKLIVFLVILCISLVFIQMGATEYKSTLDHKKNFQSIEKAKVDKILNHRLYGTYGIRMLFLPSVHSIFVKDSGVLPDMMSFVDSGERLKIYYPLVGKKAFEMGKKRSGFSDFSGILLFFMTLLALAYGYDGFSREKYLKFLSSRFHGKPVFVSILVSRLLILFLSILAYLICALLLIMLNGLSISPDIHLLYLLFRLFLAAGFFFLLGVVFGTVKSKLAGISSLVIIWFVLLFVIPPLVNTIIAETAKRITPVYKLELEKIKIFMDWENRSIEEAGTLEIGKEITDKDRELVADYLNKEFKRIEGLEERMYSEMESHIELSQWISILFPTTSYQSSTNELSSRGYENLLAHYRYVRDLKHEFVKYILGKVYFSNFSKVESFIKENSEKNIFYAQPRLPRPVIIDLIYQLLIISLLVILAYRRYTHVLYREPDEAVPDSVKKAINVAKGGYKVIRMYGEDLSRRLFNLLSGFRTSKNLLGFENKIFIDNHDIVTLSGRQDFLYLCSWTDLPLDVKVKDFIEFFKQGVVNTVKSDSDDKAANEAAAADVPLPEALESKKQQTLFKLKPHERSLVLLHILEHIKTGLYVIDDFTRDMPRGIYVSLKDQMDRISREGGKVLCLTTTLSEPPDEPGYQDFLENTIWNNKVENFRKKD